MKERRENNWDSFELDRQFKYITSKNTNQYWTYLFTFIVCVSAGVPMLIPVSLVLTNQKLIVNSLFLLHRFFLFVFLNTFFVFSCFYIFFCINNTRITIHIQIHIIIWMNIEMLWLFSQIILCSTIVARTQFCIMPHRYDYMQFRWIFKKKKRKEKNKFTRQFISVRMELECCPHREMHSISLSFSLVAMDKSLSLKPK